MVPRKHSLMIVLTLFIFTLFLLPGCAGSLRYSPTEAQKSSAELTHQLAVKVQAEGTEPASEVSKKIVEGTAAAVAYMGRPAAPPNPEQFSTVTAQAANDAVQRPDVWQTADSVIELAIGICALVGGVAATKGVGYLQTAKQKSQALKEIIQGNELFKVSMEAAGNTAVVDEFKRQQSLQQTGSTPLLVTAETIPIKDVVSTIKPAASIVTQS